MDAVEYLGGRRDGDDWLFDIPRSLHGAFGGAFGGVVAAAAIIAARSAAPGRRPSAADCRFLRPLPPGTARVCPRVVHAGRSLSSVDVDVEGPDGRLASRVTVSLVSPEAVRHLDHDGTAPAVAFGNYDDADPWRNPPGVEAPIIETLGPRSVGSSDHGLATAVHVPWDDPGADAEAVCLPADLCVGPPVALAFPGQWFPHPNPDFSMRFGGPLTGKELIGVGRLHRISGGVALVGITVYDGTRTVGVGASSSLLLA